jgi:hypothetical protein
MDPGLVADRHSRGDKPTIINQRVIIGKLFAAHIREL